MITKDKLVWGKPCRRHGHQKEDGTNLRHAKSQTCMMCEKGDNLGLTQDELYEYLINPNPPKRTEEERAAGRVRASMRWNAKNKDRVKEYTSKYNAKPERKAIQATAAAERWAALTDEERKDRSKKTYAAFKRRRGEEVKEWVPPSNEELQARHARRLEKERERYANRTPEEHAIVAAKAKARREKKKDK
jgi:hypothetical protein